MSSEPDTSFHSMDVFESMLEDARYANEIRDAQPTVFFRPGDRTAATDARHFPPYADGSGFIALILEYGSNEERLDPVISSERFPIRVLSQVAKPLSAVTRQECLDAYRELATPEAILAHLQARYPELALGMDSIVTVYRVEYLD